MQLPHNAEIFRAMDRFANYEISNHGRVRNSKTGRILKTLLHNGYQQITLRENGKKTTKTIHRLVAEAFVDNPHNYTIVDHISRNKLDNSAQNLRWTNLSGNARNTGVQRNNKCGIKGIHFKDNRWRARITDNNGKILSKSFSISKYQNALELAKEWRKQKEIELGGYN